MSRHQQILTNVDDLDALLSPEDNEVFDVNELEGDLVSEATSVEDLNIDDDPDLEIDFKDQIQLFDGNVHPLEYYQQVIKEFNESAFDSKDYSKGSEKLLDAVEQQQNQYNAHDSLPFPD